MHNKRSKYKFTPVLMAVLLGFSLTACTAGNSDTAASINSGSASRAAAGSMAANTGTAQAGTAAKANVSVQYDSDDENASWNTGDATNIFLKTNAITWDGAGVAIKDNNVTITSAGTYIINGTLNGGQVLVDTEDKGTVRLVLNGANITSSDSSPVYIIRAKKTVIVLAEGSNNNLTDSKTYVLTNKEADEPNATIFSKSDLTVNGTGSLTVNANYKNAITSKDELKIMSGNITVNSTGDGIRGRDFVAIKNGIVNVNARQDGIKSNNDEDSQKGFVLIEDGTVSITAQEDGIQAETNVVVKTGDIRISSGGGRANGETKPDNQPGIADTDSDSDSKKGIKAAAGITIYGGTIDIDSADDSLHSNNRISINGGYVTAASGDDGIHADSSIEISNGEINITRACEGIESTSITINGGNIRINASDDGINASDGTGSSSLGQRPGQNNSNSSGSASLNINGGYIYVNSAGDSLDANGSILMTNGTVIISGPTENNNGALDYDGTFKMTGGFMAAAGSSGMAQAPGTASTQNSAMISFAQTMPAGTMVHIKSSDGMDLLTFKPEKDYQTIVISSPEIKTGTTYDIYYGGSSGGTEKDGLFTGGTYSGGTKYESFTVSEVVTTVGITGHSGPGGKGLLEGGRPGNP